MTHNWIVRRNLDTLEHLPHTRRPGALPDTSIVVEAMAEFIRFTGAVPAMPTIWFDGSREWLADGARLLQSLRAASYNRDVTCIWRTDGNTRPEGSEPFTAERAEQIGSRARLITFQQPLHAAAEILVAQRWGKSGNRVGEMSYGWSELTADQLPDWLTWVTDLERLLPQLPPVKALNGRRSPI